jgi:hypothetical protein
VAAPPPRRLDASLCPLNDQIPFELRDHSEHVEQQLPGRRACVYRLIQNHKINAKFFQLMAEIRKMPRAAREPVHFDHHKGRDLTAAGAVHELIQRRTTVLPAGYTVVNELSRILVPPTGVCPQWI